MTKIYTSVRRVEAEIMTMGEAYKKRLLPGNMHPHSDEEADKPGYYVYEDAMWYPENMFKDMYNYDTTVLNKLTREYQDLRDKYTKLSDFLLEDKHINILSDTQTSLMEKQRNVMKEYLDILYSRIVDLS